MKRTLPAALVLLAALGSARAAERPPNVLFLFSDDQRADTIAALGNEHVRTPNLDRLTREGTAFTRAYCMGARDGDAVCVPSRAMLMTGRTLFRIDHGLRGQPSWPEAFAQAGYRTFITGKWHNGAPSLVRCFQEGKAVFVGGMGDPYRLPVYDLADGGLGGGRYSGKHSVELFADRAAEFVRAQKGGDRPFLAYVALNAPHDPRVAPKEYHAKYDPARLPLPANYLPQHPFDNGEMVCRDELLAPWPRTPEVVRRHLADYYASIEFLDAQVGRVLDALKESGRYDNTLIVFASDHGLAIGSHGLFGKQNVYEHSMRAPLILAGPGVPKGKRSEALCYLLDIYPTLGELAEVKEPRGNEGKSLVPVMAGKAAGVRDALLTAYCQVQRAVRDDRWKLIVYPQINKSQLFDLRADPAEMKDLASDAAHADVLKRMTALLKTAQREAGDDLPLTTDRPRPLAFDFSKVKPPRP